VDGPATALRKDAMREEDVERVLGDAPSIVVLKWSSPKVVVPARLMIQSDIERVSKHK
jgi:hypothetical protein